VGHTREKCWDIYGKPVDWKPRKNKPRAHQASNESACAPSTSFSQEQLNQITRMFRSLQAEQHPHGSASMTHKGIIPIALHTSLPPSQWIVDTGASDHMTSNEKMFVTYHPLAGNKKIITATGTPSPIDIISGKMIGFAKEYDGLYCLDISTVSALWSKITTFTPNPTSDEEFFLLWHRRLGHPSVSYLQKLFLQLSINKSSFVCDTCAFAKHHRVSFPPVPYKPSSPFSIIHSDV